MVIYKHCAGCRLEALHENGVCRFCSPRLRGIPDDAPVKCGNCDEVFERLVVAGHEKRFCSRRCQQRAWDKSNRSIGWKAEKRRRENEKREYLRGLGVRRSSRLERAA